VFVPSGEQYEIAHGTQRATVVEIGGGVRAYDVDGLDVLDPYPVDAVCDGAHGTPLVPWPNRLADGRYTWDGAEYQVALTEPGKRNAIHGFGRWRPWSGRAHDEAGVTMGLTILPLMGYPFGLDVEVEYRLGEGGLTVRTTATNVGDRALPYADGQHPYLSAGGGVLDDCALEFRAATRVDTDAERQLPTDDVPVAGTPYDFSTRRALGSFSMDFAFTDLVRDGDDRAWVSLERPDGTRAEMWVDRTYPFLELYTGDTLAPDRQRRGLGTEPMTAPPNAFGTGKGVQRLEPGASTTSTWGARLAR
jgi:aldose 1-epimerase